MKSELFQEFKVRSELKITFRTKSELSHKFKDEKWTFFSYKTLTQIEKHFEGLKVAHENLLGMV
jgi:hypothetical protein